MSATSALKLEDGNGAVMIVTRIADAAFTFAFAPGEDGDPVFRMFEDDRVKLGQFIGRPLDG